MVRFHKNSRRLVTAFVAGLVAAAVPFAYCAVEFSTLRASLAAVNRTSAHLAEVRTVGDSLSQALVHFSAITIEVDDKDRAGILAATDREFLAFRSKIEMIRGAVATSLSTSEVAAFSAAIETLAHSWDEIRRHRFAMTPEDKTVHFLSIYEASTVARDLLKQVDRDAASVSQRELNEAFWRIRVAMEVLLFMVLIGALVSVASSLAMFRAAASERQAHDDLRERDEELRRHSERFEAALENMSQGLCMFDSNRRLIVCNRRYASLYHIDAEKLKRGTSVETILGMRVAAGASPKDSVAYIADRLHVAKANNAYKIVHELVDGRFIHVSHEPLPEGGWVATHEDVTEKKLSESKISHMAHHDALTGLPNRLVLANWLERRLASAAADEKFAILCLDLDLFKRVNDTLGHQYGDMLLCEVAERLRASVRESDLVVRLGGDEFAIVQSAPDQPDSAISLANGVIAVLNEPFELDGHQIVIGASIGVAVAPADGGQPYLLLKNADLALYRAKSDGRNVFRFFERTMDAKMQARRLLEVDLRKALADDELELVYQPILSVADRGIVGFEALLRWNHPTRGRVAPDDFIPLAEEIGLITAIGEWVLRQACTEAATWPAPIKVAVNLSPVQFRSPTLAHMIVSTLAASGLSPTRLELEVTEAVLVHEPEAVAETLKNLRSVGVRIAMDDFGTGYSSLSYLQRFPFDKIKIDRGFMQRTTTDADAFAIVKAVIALGKGLGMTITAEGVETQEQFDRLAAEACDEVQGFLFSPARPATEARRLLAIFNADPLKAVA